MLRPYALRPDIHRGASPGGKGRRPISGAVPVGTNRMLWSALAGPVEKSIYFLLFFPCTGVPKVRKECCKHVVLVSGPTLKSTEYEKLEHREGVIS